MAQKPAVSFADEYRQALVVMMSSFEPRSLPLWALSGLPRHRRLVILTYHRVLRERDPMLPDEPCAADFERQLTWASEFLNFLPLPEAADLLAAGRLPPRSACITFDDGYLNNYEVALPILERLGLPATFFIATGAIVDGAMWNDLIIESVRRCGRRLDLRAFGLDDYTLENEADRPGFVTKILDAMRYMPMDQRAEQSRAIYHLFDDEAPSLMMTPAMVRSLADRGFDVGGHTVNHPILESVPDERAMLEICDGRDWLASVTGRKPITFAYPNGRPGTDFSKRHCGMVREAGFRCAVSTKWGCAVPSSNMMALPRLTPWESTRSAYFNRLVKSYVQSYLRDEGSV